ncbi:MAG: carbohydrate binding family 9 domain-containing protein, partial [Planctomycetota bacterium]
MIARTAFCLAQACPALAQTPEQHTPDTAYTFRVQRVENVPIIDGRLDDEVWRHAPAFDNFQQVEPVEGLPPSQRTEVRVVYDRRQLYIAVRCFDDEADLIVARQMLRDADQWSDDYVILMLDPFEDRRNGYFFQITAAGGRMDGLTENNRKPSAEWDGHWQGRTSIDEHGWSAEIAIPFTTVSFNPEHERWGFNVERSIRRSDETIRWASPHNTTQVKTPASGGTLEGLAGLQKSAGLTVKPYTNLTLDLLDDGTDWTGGLDIFYNLSPSVTAALTLNTDFAETEVDEQIVNLTRFPVFFPEKRDFFLQDAGVFNFGGLQNTPLPFFSRRIGIVRGREKEILAGLKLTGRQDNLRFGLLDVQMKHDDELGDKNLGVARATWDILDQSSVGFIFTNGHPSERGDNQLGGIDLNFHETLDDGALVSAHAWAQGTHTDLDDEPFSNADAYAAGGRLQYDGDPWQGSFFTSHIGDGYNPALGFVERRSRRRYLLHGGHKFRPTTSDTDPWYRVFNLDGR